MNILVVGGSGGIGAALVERLCDLESSQTVVATWHRQQPQLHHPKLSWQQLDIKDESAMASCWPSGKPLDLLIYAVGMLHRKEQMPEKTIRQFDPAFFMENMRVNALPALMLASSLNAAFKLSAAPRFAAVSARVGSIGENYKGGWYSYRSSKAALNMALKTLSLEWRTAMPRGAFALLHPGTTDTPLSTPFKRGVPPEKLFSANRSAAHMMATIEGLCPANSGQFWSWDGTQLPW